MSNLEKGKAPEIAKDHDQAVKGTEQPKKPFEIDPLTAARIRGEAIRNGSLGNLLKRTR